MGVVVFHPGDDFAGKDIWIKFKVAKDHLLVIVNFLDWSDSPLYESNLMAILISTTRT